MTLYNILTIVGIVVFVDLIVDLIVVGIIRWRMKKLMEAQELQDMIENIKYDLETIKESMENF